MARAIIWPMAAESLPPKPAPGPFAGLDLAALAASLGPELSRLAGIRISARASGAIDGSPLVRVGRIRLNIAEQLREIDLEMPKQAAAYLMERMFGASAVQAAAAAADTLFELPPGSASWSSLCRHIAQALGRAFEGNGIALGGGAVLPARAVLSDAASERDDTDIDAILSLDIDGLAAFLVLTVEPLPVAPAPVPVPPDPKIWQQRAEDRAMELELPVTLRLSETNVPLAKIAPLKAGDILPLERPRMLDLLVDGRRVGSLPAADFLPPETDRTDQ